VADRRSRVDRHAPAPGADGTTPLSGTAPATHPAARPTALFQIDRRLLRRWAAGAVLFGVLYGGALLLLRRYNLEGVASDAADGAGPWGVTLFLALMAAAVMSPLPDAPIALAGLVAYGPLGGLVLVVAGSWLGAMADFLIVRTLGREAVRRRFPRLVVAMDDLADRLGIELLVVLRFLPTVSFDLVSYAAAITRIPLARFAGATLLGQLPGPTIAALVGAGVGGADIRLTLGLSVIAFAILLMLLYVRRTMRRRSDG
jgi:uncharacterized membrane protein YdjX (TVP38/TMEM64 family)